MDNSSPYNLLALCAGVGGLELGVRIARPGARAVCMVEREGHAAEVLAARMEGGEIDPAPVWSNVATFDGIPWRGVVDCVVSGDPCQPNSVAGGMLGADDDRWLLDKILAVVEAVRPARFFRENVCGNAAGQLAAIVPALERMDYRVAAGIFSAEEVGFSHRRERLFIMADRCGEGLSQPEQRGESGGAEPGREARAAVDELRGTSVADAAHADGGSGERGAEEGTRQVRSRRRGSAGGGVTVGHAEGVGRGEGFAEPSVRGRGRRAAGESGGELGDASSRDGASVGEPEASDARARGRKSGRPDGGVRLEMGNPDRGADEREAAGQVGGSQRRTAADGAGAGDLGTVDDADDRLRPEREISAGGNAAFDARWLPLAAPGPADPRWRDIIAHAPHLEPAVRRVDARLAYRVDRLRECGNGVSSLAAAFAWCALAAKLAE